MIDVCILGTGKLGMHLIHECIQNPAINLLQIYNRSAIPVDCFKNSLSSTQNSSKIAKADLYIVALPDDVIPSLNLNYLEGLVVHTSGTLSFTKLNAKTRGVLYPTQSFTKEKEVVFKEIPFCLETEFNADYTLLETFTKSISNLTYAVDEQQRQKLHLAAVFANNFSNRVLGIAYEICDNNNIDFNILQPLIQETFKKVATLPPSMAQTGPALRNDVATLKKHKSQLQHTELDIYNILTKSIQETHGTEL